MNSCAGGSFPHNGASEQLRQLAEEVSKIAAQLSRLASGTVEKSEEVDDPVEIGPAIQPDAVRQSLKERRLRYRYFDVALFADPAWDILLELLHAEICQQRVTVSSLCASTSIPSTTGVRWIAAMTDMGLLRRKPDPLDRRRGFVELTPKSSDALRRYFAEIQRLASF